MARQTQVEMTHRCGCKVKRVERRRIYIESSLCKKCTPPVYESTGISFFDHKCGHTACYKDDYCGFNINTCPSCLSKISAPEIEESSSDQTVVGVPHKCGHVVDYNFDDVREDMLQNDCPECDLGTLSARELQNIAHHLADKNISGVSSVTLPSFFSSKEQI